MRLLMLTSLLLLTGCGILPDKFDNVEFGYLAELRVAIANNDQCDHIDEVDRLFDVLQVYSTHTLNTNTKGVYQQIGSMVDELAARENPSPLYCQLKNKNLATAVDAALQTFGTRKK
jgi:hypothetical protein